MSSVVTTVAPPIHVLRLPQVRQITGLSRSTIYQLEAEQKFPRRIHLCSRSIGWIEQEVQMWLAKRVELSRNSDRQTP